MWSGWWSPPPAKRSDWKIFRYVGIAQDYLGRWRIWNRFRIIQLGARTWVWLNGKLVVENATHENFWNRKNPLINKGAIQLQTHGGEIRWRNIFIKEFGAEEANSLLAGSDAGFESIFNGSDLSGSETETYAFGFRPRSSSVPIEFFLSVDAFCSGDVYVTECVTGVAVNQAGAIGAIGRRAFEHLERQILTAIDLIILSRASLIPHPLRLQEIRIINRLKKPRPR